MPLRLVQCSGGTLMSRLERGYLVGTAPRVGSASEANDAMGKSTAAAASF